MSTPMLALPDFAKAFTLEIDASDVGNGVVLMEAGHPIAFLSKALGPKPRGLSTYEKEYMAILVVVQHWNIGNHICSKGSFIYSLTTKVCPYSMNKGSTQHGSIRSSQNYLGCSITLYTRKELIIRLLMPCLEDLVLPMN
jgi:hypothetical protein